MSKTLHFRFHRHGKIFVSLVGTTLQILLEIVVRIITCTNRVHCCVVGIVKRRTVVHLLSHDIHVFLTVVLSMLTIKSTFAGSRSTCNFRTRRKASTARRAAWRLAVHSVAVAYIATGDKANGALPPLTGWRACEIGVAPAPTLVASGYVQ